MQNSTSVAKRHKKGKLKVRTLMPDTRPQDAKVLHDAKAAMATLARNAGQIIGMNIAGLGNIFDEQIDVPSTKPLLVMASTTDLYIELARLGSDSIGVIDQITEEISSLADPKLDRYVASQKIGAMLRLIGKQTPRFIKRFSYGLVSSRAQKHGYDKMVVGAKAARNAGAMSTFSRILPKSFRAACITTARSSKRIMKMAKAQDEKATGIQNRMNTAFSQDLLPTYANAIAENADAIPVLAKQRGEMRTALGIAAKDARPDPSLTESEMLRLTNSLVNAMIAVQQFREKYFLRAGALNVSSEGVVSARAIHQNTGARALEHVDQLGFMLIVHFFRMLTISLLALSVALGYIDETAIENYWRLAQVEDEMTHRALAGGNFSRKGE